MLLTFHSLIGTDFLVDHPAEFPGDLERQNAKYEWEQAEQDSKDDFNRQRPMERLRPSTAHHRWVFQDIDPSLTIHDLKSAKDCTQDVQISQHTDFCCILLDRLDQKKRKKYS